MEIIGKIWMLWNSVGGNLPKLEPDRVRVEELAIRFKDIAERIFLRDPNLNKAEIEELKDIREEIKSMGLVLTQRASFISFYPEPKIEVEVTVWIPNDVTIH